LAKLAAVLGLRLRKTW